MAAKYGYSSQQLSVPEGSITQRLVMFNPGGGKPGGLLLAYEHDTWMLAIGQPIEAGEPPADFDAMLNLASTSTTPGHHRGTAPCTPHR